jgi:hypothetical protein
LFGEQRHRGVTIGVTTSVAGYLWHAADLYPTQRCSLLPLTEDQRAPLALFTPAPP